MSTGWKVFLGCLGLLFACLIIWVVRTTPDEPAPVEKIEAPRTMSYGKNTLTEEQNGVVIWDLTAENMEVETATQNAILTDLTAHFYQKDGNTVELRAKHGVYDQLARNIHVNEDVIVTTKDGAKLTCDTMDWIAGEGMLVAEGKVKITKDDLLAEGDRIESRNGFQHFWIRGNAHIVKGVKQDETQKK